MMEDFFDTLDNFVEYTLLVLSVLIALGLAIMVVGYLVAIILNVGQQNGVIGAVLFSMTVLQAGFLVWGILHKEKTA